MASDPNAPVSRLMLRHLGLKGEFEAQVRAARRRMPREVWQEAEFLVDVARLEGNPRLAMQVDATRVRQARGAVLLWLEGPGPREWLIRRVLGGVASFFVSLFLGLWALWLLAGGLG